MGRDRCSRWAICAVAGGGQLSGAVVVENMHAIVGCGQRNVCFPVPVQVSRSDGVCARRGGDELLGTKVASSRTRPECHRRCRALIASSTRPTLVVQFQSRFVTEVQSAE